MGIYLCGLCALRGESFLRSKSRSRQLVVQEGWTRRPKQTLHPQFTIHYSPFTIHNCSVTLPQPKSVLYSILMARLLLWRHFLCSAWDAEVSY